MRGQCPGNPAAGWELTTPLPNVGCSNAFNLANMAAEPRDLFGRAASAAPTASPRGAAVQRYQRGQGQGIPLESTRGN